MAKHSPRILELARRGAEARLQDMVHEAKLLLELFPHLRDSFDKDELPLPFIMARSSGRVTKQTSGGPKRRMSPAARKAVGMRMKKYWAERRTAKAKGK